DLIGERGGRGGRLDVHAVKVEVSAAVRGGAGPRAERVPGVPGERGRGGDDLPVGRGSRGVRPENAVQPGVHRDDLRLRVPEIPGADLAFMPGGDARPGRDLREIRGEGAVQRPGQDLPDIRADADDLPGGRHRGG